MTADPTQAAKGSLDPAWRRYATALLHSMEAVRAETSEDLHPVLLETADYWLSLGLAIGTQQSEAGRRLLRLIEAEEPERAELAVDAQHFVGEALG
jgi:hypothetical protein